MQRPLLLLLASLAATAAVAQDTSRAAQRQAALEASRPARYGEGDPIPKATPKVPREERRAARAARRPEGAAQARSHPVGEGNPRPPATMKVPREQRVQARAERKAESRRANQSGEITSRGEASY